MPVRVEHTYLGYDRISENLPRLVQRLTHGAIPILYFDMYQKALEPSIELSLNGLFVQMMTCSADVALGGFLDGSARRSILGMNLG